MNKKIGNTKIDDFDLNEYSTKFDIKTYKQEEINKANLLAKEVLNKNFKNGIENNRHILEERGLL